MKSIVAASVIFVAIAYSLVAPDQFAATLSALENGVTYLEYLALKMTLSL